MFKAAYKLYEIRLNRFEHSEQIASNWLYNLGKKKKKKNRISQIKLQY